MRGIFCFIFLQRIDTRFNPAYAGNMKEIVDASPDDQVQPRVCGEYTKKIMK